MKKLITIILVALSASTYAQEQCGTDELIIRNPFLMEEYNNRVDCTTEIDLDTAQILTIPIVFHILHLGEAVGEETNISDEQVLSCIENLNHRFRGDTTALSELTTQYDEYELSLVKDGKIEFCLAARDPDNNPTDGINRYDCSGLTYEGESYAEDGVNASAFMSGIPDNYIKQQFHWPEDKYFNCYVVSEIDGNNGNNGIQGYSYVGSSGTGTNGYIYGPVCLYNVTGTVGTLKFGRTLNATWAHEIGHALNLYHTFGFTSDNCDEETNPCTQGDLVADTPPTSSNNGCSPNECPDAMVQNYMDYTSENCKVAFTQGQIERMRDEIYTGLPYLINGNNVSCQSPNSKDVAVTSISVPSDWCLPTIDFNVKINNFGGEAAENVTLLVNGISYEVPTVEADGFVLIPLTDFVLGNGIIECEVIYELDEFLDNNVLTQSVEIVEQNWVEIYISPDVWSNELDWELIDEFGDVIISGGDWPVFSEDSTFISSTCLPEGCYTFKLYDSAGDGMCTFDFDEDGVCDYFYDAFLRIVLNNEVVFELTDASEMDFGSQLTFEFCHEIVDCEGDVNGDSRVSVTDVMTMLSQMGCVQIQNACPADLNGDGVVNSDDLFIVLGNYGNTCSAITLIAESDWEIKPIATLKVYSNLPLGYYDLSGRWVSSDEGTLRSGIYILIEESDGSIVQSKIFIQ